MCAWARRRASARVARPLAAESSVAGGVGEILASSNNCIGEGYAGERGRSTCVRGKEENAKSKGSTWRLEVNAVRRRTRAPLWVAAKRAALGLEAERAV